MVKKAGTDVKIKIADGNHYYPNPKMNALYKFMSQTGCVLSITVGLNLEEAYRPGMSDEASRRRHKVHKE